VPSKEETSKWLDKLHWIYRTATAAGDEGRIRLTVAANGTTRAAGAAEDLRKNQTDYIRGLVKMVYLYGAY
jgi:hypothetical protein